MLMIMSSLSSTLTAQHRRSKAISRSVCLLVIVALFAFFGGLSNFEQKRSIAYFQAVRNAETMTSPTTTKTDTSGNRNMVFDKRSFDDTMVDWTDEIFTNKAWGRVIVLESHQLLFFHVPKVASSEWKKMIRRIMGYKDWAIKGPHNPKENGLKYLGDYSRERQYEFMTSPNWTRAIFVRDPLERTLSAYLDKAVGTEKAGSVAGSFVKRFCCQIYRRNTEEERQQEVEELRNSNREHCLLLTPYEKVMTQELFPYETFVRSFIGECSNVHWDPQSQRIHPPNWKFINFVGHFDRLQEDARSLLERIGAWDEFGANGWGRNGDLSFLERNLANHATSSKMNLQSFYKDKDGRSSDVERLVMQFYKEDYDHPVLNLTKPQTYYHYFPFTS